MATLVAQMDSPSVMAGIATASAPVATVARAPMAGLIAGTLILGLAGGLVMLVFIMRTREVAMKLTWKLTRKLARGAKNMTERIRKRITFSN